MRGTITGKHLVLHCATIIRGFGLGCWLRCLAALFAAEPTTFLAVACAIRPSRRG